LHVELRQLLRLQPILRADAVAQARDHVPALREHLLHVSGGLLELRLESGLADARLLQPLHDLRELYAPVLQIRQVGLVDFNGDQELSPVGVHICKR